MTDNARTADLFPDGWTWQAKLTIDEVLLDAFSRLTGDVNALHMDSTAARVFPYRQRVTHGMLPVSVLLLTGPLCSPGIILRKISGRFNHPVFIGDTITLDLALMNTETGTNTRTFSFTVLTSSVRGNATYGEITIGTGNAPASGKEQPTTSLVSVPLDENTLELTSLAKGTSQDIPFVLSANLLSEWTALLNTRGACSQPVTDHGAPSPDLGAVLLSSTLVGMRLPGRLATFLDFTFTFQSPLALLTAYALKGTIEFVSAANQIVIENVSIYDKNTSHNFMQGKITVKMNETSRPAPLMNDLSTDLGLKGKTVLITGASRGIGATTARLFACHGAHVIVNFLKSEAEAQTVVADIVSNGGKAVAIKADVRRPEEVNEMFVQARKHFGDVDILVNNAVGDFLAIPFQALTWERLQQDIDIIVRGAFNCCQEAIPAMIQKKAGRIINLGTIATETPPSSQSKYVIAKSALVGLTRSLAVELAGHNILVNLVMPGMVETDLTKTIAPAIREKIKNHIPLARHTSTVDVAKAILTLASSLTPYTTGQKILVTGGLAPFI